ncbi:hypothetical protein [Halosolutus halophilus]|uniref:hypothetical protein n=1 Tax=Halosolutus halophilus TaxID=1552990 RepID=UPI00223513E7|nr:hypothetical protein [Halosolutus halophilus]
MTEPEAETDKTDRLKSVYLSVTGGDTEPVVETQVEESSTRELRDEQAAEAVGPAEHHGLDDAIDDPEPG